MIRAVLFDLDGTLGNTLPLCLEAFRRTIREIDGRELEDEEISCYFGPSDSGVIDRLLPDNEEARTKAYELFLRHYKELHPVMAPKPFPGISELLQMLDERGICLGVVTGKEAETAAITLAQFGLAQFFGQFVETGSPEKVVKAEKICHLGSLFDIRKPEEVVYIGDIADDVKSARQAGAVAVSAAWAPTADIPSLRKAFPSHLFVSVGQLKVYLDKQTSRCCGKWPAFLGYAALMVLLMFIFLFFMEWRLGLTRETVMTTMIVTYFLFGLGLLKFTLDRR